MDNPTLNSISKWKKRYCKGEKGAYAKMRSACKKYVENKHKKAKPGKKTETKMKARKDALKIVNSTCVV